jgi:hypothetical protein
MLVTQQQIDEARALMLNAEYQAILKRIDTIESELEDADLNIGNYASLLRELKHFGNCRKNYTKWMKQ